MNKDICFVVLNYNDANTTIKLVDSLCEWKNIEDKIKVVVVDNKSQDNSYEKLLHHFEKSTIVDVILAEKNGGYSCGNNLGARYAIKKYCPKYIAIANPDIEICQSTFEQLMETFLIDEKIAMAAPVMQNVNGNYSVYAQILPQYKDDLRACFNSKTSKTILKYKHSYVDGCENMILTQILPGSFFVIDAKVFEKIGMFDENVFLFCEERILGKKLSEARYKSVLRSDLFFVHVHATSIGKTFATVDTYRMIMNSRMYYEKKYNNISKLQEIFLKLCMRYFIVNLKVRTFVYKLLKG